MLTGGSAGIPRSRRYPDSALRQRSVIPKPAYQEQCSYWPPGFECLRTAATARRVSLVRGPTWPRYEIVPYETDDRRGTES